MVDRIVVSERSDPLNPEAERSVRKAIASASLGDLAGFLACFELAGSVDDWAESSSVTMPYENGQTGSSLGQMSVST